MTTLNNLANQQSNYKRVLAPVSAILLLAAGVLVAIPPIAMEPQPAAAETPFTDFNGDGFADLAIGAPDIDSLIDFTNEPGSVNVIYGSSSGLSATKAKTDQLWTQNSGGMADSAEPYDAFGWSLTTGDFNNDGRTDLAIGVPLEDVGSITDAGAVNVIYGSSQGLKSTAVASGNGRDDQFFTQDSTNIEETAEAGETFGASLAAGDFNNDGFADLAIGVPLETCCFSNIAGVGAVNVIYGSSNGLSASAALADQVFLGSSNVQETPEAFDRWGTTLAVGDFNNDGRDDLAIGAPEEDIFSDDGTGAVSIIYGGTSGLGSSSVAGQTWIRDNVEVEGDGEDFDNFGAAIATGDFNNDGFDDLAASAPRAAVGTANTAGSVNVIYGSSSGLSATAVSDQLWSQDSPDIEDSAENGDNFGRAVAAGDFNNDGFSDLAAGVPLETLFGGDCSAVDDGAVNVIYGSSSGLSATATPDQFWNQDGWLKGTICEVPGPYDTLGSALASGDFNNDGRDDLAIGVRGEGLYDFNDEEVKAVGSINVIYGSSAGLTSSTSDGIGPFVLPDQVWNRHTPSIEGSIDEEDFFGWSLASG